ncbi:hypothetical protein OAA89_00910 [bacterium]|nr:hypothetical protein [bacterium]
MPAIEHTTLGANQWHLNVNLKSAALFSIVVHALFIWFMADQLDLWRIDVSQVKKPLTIQVSFQKPRAVLKKPTTPDLSSKTKIQDEVPQSSKVPSSTSTPATSKVTKKIRSQVLAIPSLKESLSSNNYSLSPKCTPRERKTRVRNCDTHDAPYSKHSSRPYQKAIAGIFIREPVTISRQYRRDMARVESLVDLKTILEKRISALESKAGSVSAADLQFLKKERRVITNEIIGIDDRYKEVNLLDVLGSGIKTVKKAAKTIIE